MKRLLPRIVSAVLLVGLVLAMAGCENVEGDLIAGGGNEASETDVGDVVVGDVTLIEGPHLLVGALMANWVGPDDDDWEDTGWRILEAHAHVAVNATDIPQRNGNPVPGKFEWKGEDAVNSAADDAGIVLLAWEVPLSDEMIAAGEVAIAVHLEVVNDQETEDPTDDVYESVWADGIDFDGRNWATYFEYELGSNPSPLL